MLARISFRQAPLAARVYARSYTSSIKEGSVAASREFGKKEKAHEDQYIKQEERRKLEKLRAEMEKKKAELAELQKQHDEISSA
ncbi:hypothetical protein H4582DRAFT_1992008 [Lactarius indigo]|nr:hypothetical protein H4582DRAFT_2014606 [Lactarius indigo]KAI9432651.1 hypothetical protein H4582DRAFT_1992008 [Lactarius indigo]